MIDKLKEFKPTSLSIDNKIGIYFLTFILCVAGIMTYNSLPKDNFPEIVIPTIYISTIYPGTSPKDMENLVTRKIEKQLKSVSGIKKITSNSLQDFATIMVEFNTDVDVAVAKQKVKDAVDKSKPDLPSDLPDDPNVMEIDFSEMPIMNINIYGDVELEKLKKVADDIKDKVEAQKEITRCDMIGAPQKEIQVNVDLYKMAASRITFRDIESAIAYENMTISGGAVDLGNKKRALRVDSEIKDASELNTLVVKNAYNSSIQLQEIAEIKETSKEKESYARYNGQNVITLNVVKRSGENLINASDKIQKIIDEFKASLPETVKISITADQSEQTRTTIHDLNNTIIIGFILVFLVLMFFMGVTNAFFVALSVPLSIFLAFIFMPTIGFGLNMIVLFALLFALGIIVDDAIVVIENTYRIFENGKRDVVTAAKMAAGEIFLPVFIGTLTTLCPFIPLAFWQGIVGKFMFYLPITLIITLIASLIIAFIINPVFAVDFMKPTDHHTETKKEIRRSIFNISSKMFLTAIGFYITGFSAKSDVFLFLGNLTMFCILLVIIYKLFLKKIIYNFEHRIIPNFVEAYKRVLTYFMRGWKPVGLVLMTIGLFILSVILFSIRPPKVTFFPAGEPNFVYVYVQLPVGTHQAYTDSITSIVEDKVKKVVNNSPIVESITTNVAIGASDPAEQDRSTASNKARISVVFKKFADREGISSGKMLDEIRKEVQDMQGVKISVAQEQNGPPVGAPINIELAGEDLEALISTSEKFKRYIDSSNIEGIENLKSDFVNNAPELLVQVDRIKAAREGISSAQVGMELRTAIFGKEVSSIKDGDDDVPIQVRFTKEQRNSMDQLLNTIITFRDMSTGMVKQIPLASLAEVKYSSSYGSIKRKGFKRVITLYSNVLNGYNANEINTKIREAAKTYPFTNGVTINLTGEQEEQAETSAFLGRAMLISLALIFLLLVLQFNSITNPIIIISEIFLSIIGVLFGFGLTGMEMPIIMVGIGIVGLAGIVVKNGILILEFTEVLRAQGMGLYDSVIEAGATRLKPVLLTATATCLGLVPLALGLNIDFYELFLHGKPNFFLGGDSVTFWGPLSWTIIFGLTFATFLTLVLVPGLYIIVEKIKEKYFQKKKPRS